MTLHEELLALVLKAAKQGKVVTISQHSIVPFRMGRYYTQVHVRDMREGFNYMIVLMDSENDCDREFKQENLPL